METDDQNLYEKILDVMTRDYKDDLDINKDLLDYLTEKDKTDLLSTYLSYGYAGNNEYVVEEIVELQDKKKEEIIDKIINFLDKDIISILNFFNKKRIFDAKSIANKNGLYNYGMQRGERISFDTIKILKQLNFIFCKRTEDGIVLHMPEFIRNKINRISGDMYLPYYDEIIWYSKGIANTYGAIDIQQAYDIIKHDILIDFERYSSIIKFVSLLELEPIFYSFEHQCLCDFNIDDNDVMKIIKSSKNIVVYDKQFYKEIAKDKYILELQEYNEFRNFLRMHYNFDINEDEAMRGEIINDYVDRAQLDEEKAAKELRNSLGRFFEINEKEENEIIKYIKRIYKKMPIWKRGGEIEEEFNSEKVGRNQLCPCRFREKV